MASDDRRRAIGNITFVAADRLVVELHRGNDNFTVVGFDDIHCVARLGSFVMIPVQSEYVVAEVIGLWEKDPTTGRVGRDGANEIDKASSAKYLELVQVAIDEDVDLVGINVGGHVKVVHRVVESLRNAHPELPVFAGGSVPPWAKKQLEEKDVEVYPPGSQLDHIVDAAKRLTSIELH
jgi:methylmalonyl-CoA mutase cobalamin-binding domain/chain